jgi:hypothetical protein
MDAIEQQVYDNVRRHGWHCVAVLPRGDEAEGFVPFAYTVGLWKTHRHPELIVLGAMRAQVLHALLASAVANVETGTRYEPGRRYPGIMSSFKAEMRPVSRANRKSFLTFADWFNERREFTALQLVWPDPASRFPWESGYDAEAYRQPLLAGTLLAWVEEPR